MASDYLKLVRGDVRDARAVRDAVDDVDAVVHLAALIDVERSVNDPLETHDVNVHGTLNVLNESVRQGVKKFVFSSSAAVYGEGNRLPHREDLIPNPNSPYAASKAAAEHYCNAFHKSYGLGTMILRYFNVYGPGQGHNSYSGVITKFISNALCDKPLTVFGDGKQFRDFIYVDDVVKATMLALENDDSVGEVLNVCTGRPISVNELVKVVTEIIGREIETEYCKHRRGDIRSSYGDPTKAEKVLGFKAEVDLRNGLELTKKDLTF